MRPSEYSLNGAARGRRWSAGVGVGRADWCAKHVVECWNLLCIGIVYVD